MEPSIFSARCCRDISKSFMKSTVVFLTRCAKFPGDEARLARLSLIDESAPRSSAWRHLATVGSHTVNGVAQLHSELLKQTVLRDFAELWPEKFCNVTNGVTPRRFVALSNPGLAQLITTRIGEWLAAGSQPIARVGAARGRRGVSKQWRDVKLANKRRLAD